LEEPASIRPVDELIGLLHNLEAADYPGSTVFTGAAREASLERASQLFAHLDDPRATTAKSAAQGDYSAKLVLKGIPAKAVERLDAFVAS
jgi:hypothetical protein